METDLNCVEHLETAPSRFELVIQPFLGWVMESSEGVVLWYLPAAWVSLKNTEQLALWSLIAHPQVQWLSLNENYLFTYVEGFGGWL